jgi:hypothetical protein
MTRFKQVESRIYTDQATGQVLFVPVDDMWILQEAAKPSALLKRARLNKQTFAQWLRNFGPGRPWLTDLLYTPEKGPGCGNTADLPAEAKTFPLSPEMRRFKQESSMVRICEAATRGADTARAGRKSEGESHVSSGLVRYWFDKHAGQEWFGAWLLQGKVPDKVTVVNQRQATACRQAWDYVAHLDAAAPRNGHTASAANALYAQWFRNILPADPRFWLKWLFGITPPPDGCFVVSPVHWKWRKARLGKMKGVSWSAANIDTTHELNELAKARQAGVRELLETFIKPTLENQKQFRRLAVNKTAGNADLWAAACWRRVSFCRQRACLLFERP